MALSSAFEAMLIVPRDEQRVQGVGDEDENIAWLHRGPSFGQLMSHVLPPDPPTLDPWLRPWDDRPCGYTAGLFPCSYDHDPLFHKRVAKLCANLPPELFDDILFYVDYDTIKDIARRPFTKSRRKRIERDQDSLGDLKRCSLVCRHWANHCRRYIFHGKRLVVSSVEDAEIFMEYAKKGCPSLVPVHRLIRGLFVEQRYDAPRSFCHILHFICQLCPELDDKLHWLRLDGPIPANFPRMYLGDPHWGFSAPSVRNPPSLLRHYSYVKMISIHLLSFPHAIRYARHFRYARKIRFAKVTWDKGGRNPRPSIYRTPNKIEKGYRADILARGCTDNWQLCMQAALDNRDCGLHWMSANVQQWMISLLMSSREADDPFHARNPECSVKDPRSYSAITGTELSFYSSDDIDDDLWIHEAIRVTYRFVWDKRLPMSTPIDHIPGIIVSVQIPKDSDDHHLVNIDAMFSYLERHPMPMAVIFSLQVGELPSYRTYRGLQYYMKPFRPLAFNLQAGGRQYLFICQRSKEHPFPEVHGEKYDVIGIDPVTLAPTGQSWYDDDEAMEELLGIP
ncbi:hypothetical protein BDY19DRAFT_8049 [Irpex rosettiformis]|uniref:Uncharacterized protein n=1 Tax=Irpex rosettiformis TaxID=378272 RepID=A0ACB8UII7_9APHY|nr:hypothetical protein BDY19DRAFT_8049 [Irpex rosettiformis]